MTTKDLNETDITRHLRRIDIGARGAMKTQYDLAVDYLENRQEDDVCKELSLRFPSSQEGGAGQQIFPVCLPLTDRYVSEQANAYNKPVSRSFTTEDGEESDVTKAQTKKLADALDAAKYDEIMHRNEQISVMLGSSVVWYQAKRGNVRPVLALPQDVYPLTPEDTDFVDAADPEDYLGYAVELHGAIDGTTKTKQERLYAFVSVDETIFYAAQEANKPGRLISRHPNPFAWEQAIDTVNPDTGIRTTSTVAAPGQMLTFWHKRLPIGSVIPQIDADIVNANRELNILWSVLFDDVRFQGHSVPVLKLTNPSDPKARRKTGARHPLVMSIEEDFQFHNAGVAYDQQANLLRSYAMALAQAKRMSPNDFSQDQASAVSGFAKLVDSLPKLEAREERIRRLRYMEESVSSKRLVAVLIQQGRLDAVAAKMKLRVRFADVEFPKSPDEQAKIWETQIKYNLTTPAQILMQRDGLSHEDAEAKIAENKEANGGGADGEDKQRQPPPQQGGLFGALGFGQRVKQQKGTLRDNGDSGDNKKESAEDN